MLIRMVNECKKCEDPMDIFKDIIRFVRNSIQGAVYLIEAFTRYEPEQAYLAMWLLSQTLSWIVAGRILRIMLDPTVIPPQDIEWEGMDVVYEMWFVGKYGKYEDWMAFDDVLLWKMLS